MVKLKFLTLIVGFCVVMTRGNYGWKTLHSSLGSMVVI